MSRYFQAIRIAWADMVHDYVLTFCILCALTAVISPILFLFGLKNGAIETLRNRLLLDPRNLEIHPKLSQAFTPEYFAQLRARPDVQFVVPTTRSIASNATVHVLPSGVEVDLDLIPSLPGDPLLVQNQTHSPGPGQVVLTNRSAQELGAKVGDKVVLEILRQRNGNLEQQAVIMQVAGIANPRAGVLKQLYVPLALVEAVERYKDGFSVPELGWPGDAGAVTPVFDEVMAIVSAPIGPELTKEIVNKSGLTTVTPIDAKTCLSQIEVLPGPGRWAYLLGTERDTTIGPDSLTALRDLLFNKAPLLLPFCRPIALSLGMQADRRTVTLHPLPASVPAPDLLQLIPQQPWSGPRILLFRGEGAAPFSAMLPTAKKVLTFPLSVGALALGESGEAWAPLDFMGLLREAQVKGVEYDARGNTFIYARETYAGFRLYARGLNDVDPLQRWFQAHGIDVSTEAERINDVETLDQALSEIFWILATVGVIGAAATLAASLYFAIIRQKRELCVLKLLGIGTFPLLLYPLVQSITLATISFFSALGIAYSAGCMTDYLFRVRLNSGESFVHLPIDQVGLTFGLVCCLSILASLIAGISVLSLDVAEGIRDE